MGEPLERVLCGDNSGYGSEAFSACDPRFHSKGWGKPVFMFRVETSARRFRLRRLFWVLHFVAQRQIGIATWDACSIAREARTIVTRVSKAIPVRNSAPDVGAEK